MGFFDKLKQVGNYISGGAAKVHIELDTSELGSSGKVLVDIYCQIQDADVFVDKLYLKIKAQETVRVRNHNNSRHTNNNYPSSHTRNQVSKTYSEEIVIDENFRLDANGEYEWHTEFRIPAGIEGTYKGINARHEWQVLAGLAKKGNDPDSGWVIFDV